MRIILGKIMGSRKNLKKILKIVKFWDIFIKKKKICLRIYGKHTGILLKFLIKASKK